MRKILSLPLIILILFTGITINFATHYCGGSFSASKVSLSGELATCGMEHSADLNLKDNLYRNPCCNDVTAAYTLSCNYIPSFSYVDNLYPQAGFNTFLAVNSINNYLIFSIASDETVRPPGTYTPNSVDRQFICIFQI
jgi:hypothetical protein